MSGQTKSGAAWEYALAGALAGVTESKLTSEWDAASAAFEALPRKDRYCHDAAALPAAKRLRRLDTRLRNVHAVGRPASTKGRGGDPTDIRIVTTTGDVNVSAKKGNADIKHPRLSGSNDWGALWGGGCACTDRYWKDVRAAFEHLDDHAGQKWSDLGNLKTCVYLGVICAFEDEFRRLAEEHGARFVRAFWSFLVGVEDYWRVSWYGDKVEILATNPGGGLPGQPWDRPAALDSIVRTGANTLRIQLGLWAFKLRLHSASTKVETSLKFAVQIAGLPDKAKTILVDVETA